MALFSDGLISAIEDLQAEDSQLLTVANVEGIDITQKLSVAREQVGVELTNMFARFTSREWPIAFITEPALHEVVVTPPLRLWHTYRTLELVYSDAYNNQLNNRYAGKRDQFRELAAWAQEKLIQNGVGVVWNPVPQAQTPTVTAVSGSLADGTYYVTMSWMNAAGEEGASAPPAVVTITGKTLLVAPGAAFSKVAGWNVYVGDGPQRMVLQNSAAIGTDAMWQASGSLVAVGKPPGSGQRPSFLKPLPRILQRG